MLISYPDIKPKIKSVDNTEFVFCIVRKKWFTLTPEEWVRQNFLLFLIHNLGKRFDIVVYKNDLPYILIECKEMNVVLGQSALTQTLNYFSKIQSRYFIITNGNQTFAFEKSNNVLNKVEHIEP
ncbi:MAG: type I restriction enzyme HsdR N-terminal domain-containing protein [Sphingobacteriales bacterium]|nr:type I restriction enzyme HsdR N-terminal domain-containing protein [Sphingobacteriales bacterium]